MEQTRLKIPKTTPTRYLSGIVALNIPSESGSGDWHQTQIFFSPRNTQPGAFIIERGQQHDPSAVLDDEGIYDAAKALDDLGVDHPAGPVFAANHVRAVADLVVLSALRGKTAEHIDLDEWIPDDSQKHAVLKLLQKATERLDQPSVNLIQRWIGRNRDIGITRGRTR